MPAGGGVTSSARPNPSWAPPYGDAFPAQRRTESCLPASMGTSTAGHRRRGAQRADKQRRDESHQNTHRIRWSSGALMEISDSGSSDSALPLILDRSHYIPPLRCEPKLNRAYVSHGLQSAEREPDLLLELVHAAVRDCLFPDESGTSRFAAVPGHRWQQAILPTGQWCAPISKQAQLGSDDTAFVPPPRSA